MGSASRLHPFDLVPTTSWTIVMTCGVVSLDLSADHQATLSAIMFGLTAAVWVLLMGALGVPLLFQDGRLWREAASPAVLTIVAATAVLGSRIAAADHRTVAAVLLVLAACEWAVLSGPVLRRWVTPTVGISFVLAVAAEAVALLSGTLAVSYRSRWLCFAALSLVLVGLGLYGFAAARFDRTQLRSGRGDHWIAGGALAISALSAARATQAAGALGVSSRQHQVLMVGTFVLWCAAMLWLPALIVGEILWPRLTYVLPRWATAFPIAMYSACSLAVGEVTGTAVIVTFAHVTTWLALAATLLLLGGVCRGLCRDARLARHHRNAAQVDGAIPCVRMQPGRGPKM
jgi:tellurite resistance protein TehA-like permease